MKSFSPTHFKRSVFAAMSVVFLAGRAMAAINTISAQDDGAPVGGPFPNSSAASASFLTAATAIAPVNTITFEGLPLGYSSSFTAAPGVTVNLTGPDYGDGFSGLSDTTFGNLYGFNTTPGGSEWLGFPTGSATFDFANPTASFGFWYTGVQTTFTSSLTVDFNDGSSESLNLPINVNGGAAFFGFTDAGESISAITIDDESSDAWGVDDVSYNTPSSSSVPDHTPYISVLLLVIPVASSFVRKVRAA